MRLASTAAFCLASLALAGTASAQDVQNFEPAAGTWNYFSVESARTAPDGVFVPSLYINYGHNPIARRAPNGDMIDELVPHMTTVDLLAVYGVTDWLDVSLAVPFSIIGGGDGLDSLGKSDGFALHDIRLTPKATIYNSDLLKFAVALPISAPTGDGDKFAGDETITVHPKAIGEIFLGRTRAAVNVGFKYRAENPSVGPLEVGNEVTYSAGAAHDVYDGRLFALAEVFGAIPAQDVNDSDSARPLEGLLGARYHTSWCGVFTGGAGVGFVGDYGTPQYRALAGFAWQCPEPSDRDGDGLLDKHDACPDQPEDHDDFEDSDGCPDLDNDQDGILDTDDKCPLEPEDMDTFEDIDGCPDPDNDKDGILDTDDKCPLEPEDKDNFEDDDGCPDPDNDKDGILDVKDSCPMQPEVINDFEDEDGCPDELKVKVTASKLEILDRIYFAFNSDEIDPRSFEVLDQVAAALNAHPEISKVRIEGHTDSKGSDRINRPLSTRRAASVRKYLVAKKGVDGSRLVSKGYGSRKPLKKPGTAGAADKNRRVEFIIIKGGGAAVKDTSSK